MSRRSPAMRLSLAFAGLALILAATSCAVVPETGRRQLNWMTTQEEAQAGLQAYDAYKAKRRPSSNATWQAQVRRVGSRLATVVEVPYAHWQFVVFEDDTPNAFALPGGHVGLNSGILPISQNDAGLAAIMSHEIAHVVARHSGERRSQAGLVQLGMGVLGMTIPQADALHTGVGVGAELGLLRYSRVHELEADRLGVIYMARAGYDPREAVAFWRRFAAYKQARGENANVEFLSTHPLDERRIQALEAFMPKALAEYQPPTAAQSSPPPRSSDNT